MNKVGVVVGRFQVPYLHYGHVALIETAIKKSNSVIIIVGENHAGATKNNPISLKSRKRMIGDYFRRDNIILKSIKDRFSNKEWSDELDEIIRLNSFPESDIKFYVGRDSFEPKYTGKHSFVYVDTNSNDTGTGIREELGVVENGLEERRGAVKATQRQFDRGRS